MKIQGSLHILVKGFPFIYIKIQKQKHGAQSGPAGLIASKRKAVAVLLLLIFSYVK